MTNNTTNSLPDWLQAVENDTQEGVIAISFGPFEEAAEESTSTYEDGPTGVIEESIIVLVGNGRRSFEFADEKEALAFIEEQRGSVLIYGVWQEYEWINGFPWLMDEIQWDVVSISDIKASIEANRFWEIPF